MTISILRLPHVMVRTGMSRSGIYAAVKEGSFPAAVSLGPRAVGWLESDITEWIESRPRAGFVVDAVKRKEAGTAQAAVRTTKTAAAPSADQADAPMTELRVLRVA